MTEYVVQTKAVAKAKEKERFTALFHHVSHDHLEMAFFEPWWKRMHLLTGPPT